MHTHPCTHPTGADSRYSFALTDRGCEQGPDDDEQFASELYAMADVGVMSYEQADACMAAKNRPFFCLSAMSAIIRQAGLEPMDRARLDTTISVLGTERLPIAFVSVVLTLRVRLGCRLSCDQAT